MGDAAGGLTQVPSRISTDSSLCCRRDSSLTPLGRIGPYGTYG